jgi:predicted DNA-binding transcriptional regulator AlpA
MSRINPVQPDLFDYESAQVGKLPSAAVAPISAGQSSVKGPVATRASAAGEAEQAKATAAPVAIRVPERPFLSDVAVATRYAVSRPTIWRWTKAQSGFPQPIRVSSGTTRWRLEDLQRHDLARLEQQDRAVVTKRKGGAA